jgi:hypothetical protein
MSKLKGLFSALGPNTKGLELVRRFSLLYPYTCDFSGAFLDPLEDTEEEVQHNVR